MAAVVIALSTAYTAIILRRQNRTDEDPARGKDPGGHEIVFHLSNTGRYEENVETAHYHIRHAGWQEVPPQNPMGFKIAPASQHDPSPRIEEVSKTDYPKVNYSLPGTTRKITRVSLPLAAAAGRKISPHYMHQGNHTKRRKHPPPFFARRTSTFLGTEHTMSPWQTSMMCSPMTMAV